MKTCFFDIEAGGLRAPFDQVLCAAFKPYDEKPYLLSRKLSGENDLQLCLAIRNELAKYGHVVTYYGLGFDKPFISARLLKYGRKPLPRQLHTDCYRLAKKIFKYTLVSRRLVSVCEHLGIKGKTRVEPALWENMKYASQSIRRKALREAEDHCLWDVVTLEKAYDQCFQYGIVSISLA